MKKNSATGIFLLLLSVFLLMGCRKDDTKYYDDKDAPGIAIFSDSGYNILSCFMDGKPWRTVPRTTSGFYYSGTSYEVEITKQPINNLQDTLLISWQGYFSADKNSQGYLTLHLAIPQNFTYRYLSALQGQRLHIDPTNGFFSTSIGGLNTGNIKGIGSIYFHTARFDSIAPGIYGGNMSGLFEADFTSFKITNGRFDHAIVSEQIHF